MRRIITLFSLLLCYQAVYAQSTDVGLTDYASYLYERQLILNGMSEKVFLNLQPYDRLRMAAVAQMMMKQSPNPELDYILDENEMYLYQFTPRDTGGFHPIGRENRLLRQSKKPFLQYFYRTPAQFFQIDRTDKSGRHYRIRINPIIHFRVGSVLDADYTFVNLRGVQLDASIGDQLYISTNIREAQYGFPPYIQNYIKRYKAIPENTFYKGYHSSVFPGVDGYDVLNSTAKLGFRIIPEIALEFGYGQNKLGHGIRSLVLSDFSDNYLYLSLNTRIGRVAYRNIFGEVQAANSRQTPAAVVNPKKYFATHYLGFKVTDKLQLGLYETVVFSRSNGFELNYLNPVILYRTVEGALGSPDNMMLGLDVRWDIARHFSLYGQVVFDEFKFKEVILNHDRHWWANKYAFQVGMKAFNLFHIKRLDFIGEFNYIRPFIYAHRDSTTTWIHGNQSLAHPRGANLEEFLFKLRYRPTIKWDFALTGMFLYQGISPNGENYGEDPRLSYNTRSHDYGNVMLQGVNGNTTLMRLRASYMLWHGAFVDFTGQIRQSKIDGNHTWVSLGFRWNASFNKFLY